MQEHPNEKNDSEENEEKNEKSRTRIKKDDRKLQVLGERLLTLSDSQLAGIDIPQELIDAVVDARRFGAREARHRQVQYIGALMRAIDPAPVIRAFELIDAGVSIKPKIISPSSTWLNSLIEGDDSVIEQFTTAFPGTDRQKLRQLTRNAKKTQSQPAGKSKAKALLQYINELMGL